MKMTLALVAGLLGVGLIEPANPPILPVLVQPPVTIPACVCSPSIVAFAVGPFGSPCDFEGSSQPCFTGQIINTPNPVDTPGECVAPAVAGEPPRPACGPKKACIFQSREVQIVAAPCANGGNCGVPKFQGVNQAGEDQGEPFEGGGEVEITVIIGNLACAATPKEYDVKVKDSGGQLRFTYRLRAACGQCPRLR
ncbi:hypothetical protein [Gemmatimonas sp.]|jgi:hypothetical protein|uniref:hypothetical protein n=1 Tax=Gemmatimonas sp. TaxID=1962908 RepID=UPI00333FC879